MGQLTEQWKGILSDKKNTKFIVAAGLLGMLLILLSGISGENPEKGMAPPEDKTEQYIQNMEERLTKVVSLVDGIDTASVMITLENGVEYVYAQEERLSTDLSEDIDTVDSKRIQKRDNTEKKYILVDGENGRRQALIQKEVQPVVKGVVVICKGIKSVMIEQQVTEIVTTALDIPSNKVCVTQISRP